MLMTYDVRKDRRDEIPAPTHVDGTGRLQTVRRDQNPRYHALIDAFGRRTGVPVLLNTSFNENEPICCTPQEAVETFRRTRMDGSTPPRTHAPVALQAIERGCHVLIEKPMAVTVDECDRIIEAAAQQGVSVCVAHSDLFYPPVLRARRHVAAGAIGTFTGMR